MVLEELRHKFVSCKNYEPIEQNELMDFARQLYLREELSIGQFRTLIKELERNGAVPPRTLEDILELT
ncbi:YppF family protein [Sutcliffiella halmapala]|uniref:YppF family protein n=1 Tax=Sutcliffiella halmapala TaxID=79882 RepID=UPI000994E693|nr:YppF family protein [Sutcliffiella halmapala]